MTADDVHAKLVRALDRVSIPQSHEATMHTLELVGPLALASIALELRATRGPIAYDLTPEDADYLADALGEAYSREAPDGWNAKAKDGYTAAHSKLRDLAAGARA